MSFKPKRPGRRQRIYSGALPPGCFIPAAMDLPVMRTAERHGKLIAHLAPESLRLREAQMVRIRRAPTANQTRLLHNVSDMIAVSNATRFRECEDALINLDCRLGRVLLIVGADRVAPACMGALAA
jgi:hypothetical protein